MMFYMPAKVYEEKNAVLNHADEIKGVGTKALIVTGRNSAKACGALSDVVSALSDTPYVIFDEVEENPSIETVMKAREIGVSENVDFVIGIGGGSPMDAAKAIALMICNGERDESLLYDKSAETKALPVVAVPTTCGTGSEVTGASVLTIHEKRTKAGIPHKIFPVLSLVDAKYLRSASLDIIKSTSVDALAHLVESVINSHASPFSLMCAENGLAMWSRVKEPLITGNITDADYDFLMHSSVLAGMAIAHTGTSIPHGLSYAVTYEVGVPHGRACGIFLANYLKAARANGLENEVDVVLALLGFSSEDHLSEFMDTLFGKTEIPKEILENATLKLSENKAKLAYSPFLVNYEMLCEIAGLGDGSV